ncbi:IS256 family transposase [Cyclobacteriaceae bacterium YHN15]|nr:IS256 family transposase [Cyclobacteriaceae bacterium YHN15]
MKEKEEEFDFKAFAKQAGDALRSGKPLAGKDGVFTPLLKMVIESALEGELEDHLTETRKVSKNRRNGHGSKNIQSSLGGFEVLAPRDRNSSFEPQIVGKRQHKISSDIDQQIIALFGRGMSYRDIQQHVGELYGIEVSEGTITAITDRLYPQIVDWQSRPLESLYPVVWLDAMHFKVREDGTVKTKAVYSILGVTKDGQKEVLGVYFGDHESSKFWRQVLHELKLRGVKDILIICIDNLSGFAEAVEDVFPQTDVQLCLVHQMRNSMKCISEKDLKPMVRDLKKIYKADNVKMAAHYLQEAESIWGEKYRVVFRSWHRNWDRLTNFYKYPPQLRRLIYTTNPIESYHRMVRKVTKTKGAFSSENAILKQIYLATMNAQTKWNGSIFAWPSIRKDLIAYFDERFEGNDTV